jgi:hypothetical protein
MVHMSAPQQPIDLGDPSVIDFGPAPARERRGGLRPGAWARSVLADHRVVPVLAALAAVAAVASLVSEWQVTKVSSSAFDIDVPRDRLISADLNDLGALGGGYVVGVLALSATFVLLLFGPGAARRALRLAGLGVAGALVAVVAGIASSLGRQSRAIPSVFNLEFTPSQLQLTYGRGLWCAAAAVLFAGAALLLSGRAAPPPVRPRQAPDDARQQPIELTVSPAAPFAAPPAPGSGTADGSGRQGISG